MDEADEAACTFCEIAADGSAGHRVFEDATAVAFLDARPLFPGHVLVVPRRHAETLTDLAADEVGPFFARVQRIAGAVERGMGAAGSFVAANNRVSQSVPHFHVHVVPRNRKDGLRGFFWPRGRYASDEEAARVAARVRAALESGPGDAGPVP
ncbi:HIT domain-containing protein [Streptomyces klenkii]|uniref:HIT domain-containing protein n=1 Tax=Streptomyces klenkii TaxID=1420899 RepID=A0A3B0AXV8_9ACTN|nr:HIT domain-containing protein [Streptomyces klenkii]RKN65250.1 HIT domain-containing protein [Streptomyces klenkii]